MEEKNEIILYVQNISLFFLGILFLAFPVIFTTITTNPFILPKQTLLGIVVAILLVLQIVKMFIQKSVKYRRTSFDIPVFLLGLAAFLSAMLAINKADALTAFIPYFFAILGFYLIVNIVKDKNSLLFLMSSLVIGGILLSVSAILSFFKIYILSLPGTHTQAFTPLGSSLEQEIYFIAVFAVAFYYVYRLIKSKTNGAEGMTKLSQPELTKAISFGVASLIILMGIIVTTYSLFKLDKPLLLPAEAGFQISLSEISLDSGRIAQGFLLGSGFGTYAVDFSRWKQITFNQNQDIWGLTFSQSSNFIFELLTTTGVLGLCAYIFLLIRVLRELKIGPQNKMLISVIVMFLISLLLPFGFASQVMFFILLGLFAANQGLISKAESRFFDIELQLVTFKKGLIAMEVPHAKNEKSLVLPSVTAVVILALIAMVGRYSIPYLVSDMAFQRSFIAAAQNNGSLWYQEQAGAIQTFPQRDGFYRVFSQTNLTLANTLASQQKAGTTLDKTTQQNITTLIQQSIDAARAAATISPQTYLNWQNLSSVYRGLIGFGQNAETFAIATAQQSISLDPNSPQEYIILGGIYYQLGQWDNAQNQFQLAVALKPDFANSHYNLGHTLEQKGDLQDALTQYEAVRTLVVNDKPSLDQINKEIASLQGKAQTGQEATTNTTPGQTLNVNKPEAQLPAQNPPVKIPAPPTATQAAR
jgi:tetratricopeptide (TPR) repeat protein